MFRRIKEFLKKISATTPSVPSQPYAPCTDEFTFESLWDDYERRTWHYDSAKTTLGVSNPRLLHWIGSIDQSGYTREKCLRALISNFEPGDENRILLRLSDWVPEVRALARQWVMAGFHSLPPDAIRANQRLILYLSRKDRLRDDVVMREIARDLRARTRNMEPAGFFEFTPMFRRFLFSQSFADDGHLRPWILDDPEPFNRSLLLSQFEFSQITDDEKQRLRADKSVFVRRTFFHKQVESGVALGRDELLALALDPNRSLREFGQFYLKKYYADEAYWIYRESKDDEFFYIADYARAEDAEHFLEGVRSGSRATQYNCLRALASAAPERLKELRIPELISQNRKLRSVLLRFLPRLLSIEEIVALRSTFEKSSPQGTIRFFRVLQRKSFWAFLDEGLADLLSEPESARRQMIVYALQKNSSIYEPLSLQLRDSISGKISQLRQQDPKRNKGIADLLDFTIRTT